MANYGASPGAWDLWRSLGVEDDLLPAVANPDATIAEHSTMQGVGKTPSRYNQQREVVGIGKWTLYMPGRFELEAWAKEPDYAISVQTRGPIKAIDVDVPDPVKSAAIRDAITDVLGPCPVRYRDNSGKLLLVIRHEDPMPKAVLQVEGGMIEILGDGQQFIADGYHQSGSRYQWNGTALPEMPEVSGEQLAALREMLEMCFGTGPWKIAREKRDGAGGLVRGVGEDAVVSYLVDNWKTFDEGPGGQIFIECPFAAGHSSDSGPTSTAYFPAGTGGYAQGHFVCLHASCAGRDDRDYLDAVDYSVAEFAGLGAVSVAGAGGSLPGEAPRALPELTLVRDGKGRIEATADNLVKMCGRADQIGKTLAFDSFKDELVWAPGNQPVGQEQWRPFSDIDYTDVRIELERRGTKPMSKDMLRDAVKRASFERQMDTAQVWLGRLEWDGVDRIDSFCIAGWGWEASDYSRAVGRYLWTALAGRVLQPGVQADMAPILVGPQGLRKTSAIKAMVPDEEHYLSVPLDGHDTDTSRQLRGKLVGELEELRGLNSRAIEVIKAWITRTSENWIPKYVEFEVKFKRRLIFIGSTNEDEFLADPTGERRWLPGRCGAIDVDWIKANRDQLWAEGAAKFMVGGVDWEEAERLGTEVHHEFKVTDSWEGAVARWLLEPLSIDGKSPDQTGHVSLAEVLAGAVNIPIAQQDRTKEMRMAKVLRHLGWNRKRLSAADGSRPWAYVKGDK